MANSNTSPSLLDELRHTRREVLKTGGPLFVVALLGFLVAIYFVEPPPPTELVIATGSPDGGYYDAARKYARMLKEHGITLEVRETAGSVENYELLLNDNDIDLAIVQGGTSPEAVVGGRLESLATLYLEPIWVFLPKDVHIQRLAELQGKRIAVGAAGSGTQALTHLLLHANGVRDGEEGTSFVMAPGQRATEMLETNDVDAAFFVLSAESPLIRDLLRNEQIELLSFDRSRAYAQRYPFLEDVVLSQGVVDLEGDLPDRDVQLVAPAANLIATSELHDALIPLLLEAATETHQMGGLVTEPGAHPSLDAVEFPPSAIARHYLKHGPSFFQKYLGFWVASLIDRTKIMLVPLIVLLIPLVKLAPPVYRWRIRSRIYRWYGLLREIDQGIGDERELDELGEKLGRIERELGEVVVPLSYMEEFYHLHLHINLVKQHLEEHRRDEQQSH